MNGVQGGAEPDDRATAAVPRTTDPDGRISDAVVRSIGTVQDTTDREARMTRADGLRTDPEGRMTDFILPVAPRVDPRASPCAPGRGTRRQTPPATA
jgi:hypothetical protein